MPLLNSYTNGGGCHARCQLAHQEQYLAQGHFDIKTRGIKPATFWLEDAGSTPEPHSPVAILFSSSPAWTAGPLLLPEIWQGVYSSTQQVVSWLTQQIHCSEYTSEQFPGKRCNVSTSSLSSGPKGFCPASQGPRRTGRTGCRSWNLTWILLHCFSLGQEPELLLAFPPSSEWCVLHSMDLYCCHLRHLATLPKHPSPLKSISR